MKLMALVVKTTCRRLTFLNDVNNLLSSPVMSLNSVKKFSNGRLKMKMLPPQTSWHSEPKFCLFPLPFGVTGKLLILFRRGPVFTDR